MTVISEEKLCQYLAEVLTMSGEVLERIPNHGTEDVSDELVDRYLGLVNRLNADRDQDSALSDDSWNWIWENKSSFNHIRLYGRLAWINLQLLELL